MTAPARPAEPTNTVEGLIALHPRGFGFLTCGEGTPDIFVHMETLRRYAERRRDASLAFVDALRAQDAEQARKALDQARQASRTLLQPQPADAGRVVAAPEGTAKDPRSR